MSTPQILVLVVTVALALPIVYRTVNVLHDVSPSAYGNRIKFHGFAMGYAALSALSVHLVIEAIRGQPVALIGLGYMLASDFLILCYDRRRTDDA